MRTDEVLQEAVKQEAARNLLQSLERRGVSSGADLCKDYCKDTMKSACFDDRKTFNAYH